MNDDISPTYENYKAAKEIMDSFEVKYSLRFDTYIQLLWDKYNQTYMKENDDIGNYILQM